MLRNCDRVPGKLWAIKLSGMALRGPTRNRSCRSKYTSLSPPRPLVRTSTASTIVLQAPTSAPSARMTGRPPDTTAMSVVVPPMSETTKSVSPVRNPAPTTLAAGPDRMVSTGHSSAIAAFINEPSPLTIISGASIDSSVSTRFNASIRCRIWGVSRAFNAAVRARRGASSFDVNSCAQVTGLWDSARIIWRARNSCAGLRTEKFAATANASTRASCSRTARSMAASSSNADSSPVALWPPLTRTTTPSCRCNPVRSAIASSNPIRNVQTGLKRLSTTAFVARVVDTETRLTSLRLAPAGTLSRTARIARPMPIARFQGVVSALALAMMRRPSASNTASVNVPPVSRPSHRAWAGDSSAPNSAAGESLMAPDIAPPHWRPQLRP